MHYYPLVNKVSGQKLAQLKCCKFVKNIFSANDFFMHICNMSVTDLQNIKRVLPKAVGGVDFTKHALSVLW